MQGRGNAMRGMPMMVLMMAVVMVGSTAVLATNYKVGDDAGWTIMDYEPWVTGKTFVVGDTLQFVYTSAHDVVEVSDASYTACTAGSNQIHTDGNTTFNLNTTGPMYYICSVGTHCAQGMKVSVTVVAASSPTSPTSPGTTTTPSSPNSSPLSLPPSFFTLLFLSGVTLFIFHSL